MTPNPPLNGEITKPTCHGGTVCWACRLQHGCLTKAIRAPLRLHRAEACLSVCGWMSVCIIWGGTERGRVVDLMLTGQFQAVGPDGPVWPLIPQAIVQVSICLHAHRHSYIHKNMLVCMSIRNVVLQPVFFFFHFTLKNFLSLLF